MEKTLHGLRVAYENWEQPDRFAQLLQLLEQYDTGITQVALFSSSVHSPLTMPETARRAAIMRDRLCALKQKGYSAGINILATIGHHEEDLPHTVGAPYRPMVGSSGKVSHATFCMNDPVYLRDYVAGIYRIYAEAVPDFIWVDDDIRCGHMPIGDGCFCDDCIADFNTRHGYRFTRETLCEALAQEGADPAQITLRKRWLDRNSDAICGLFRVIGSAVRGVDEKITLGFMTGERYSEGYQFARYADALSDGGSHQIMWRPGGGAYTDYAYDELVEKSEQIARQNAYLPPYVTVILSEIENFPYNLIKKTPKSTALEAALTMTVGCTGAAFNILPSETGEPLQNAAPHLAAIAALKPFYLGLQQWCAGLTPVGIGTGWRIDSEATRGFFRGTGWGYGSVAREVFSFGLPQSFSRTGALVTVLIGTQAAVMTDDEIRQLLSGGVYLDAGAAQYLTDRGFGGEIGFAVDRSIPVDARERYTDDPLNAGITGGLRNCRQAFHPGDSVAIIPQAPGCRVLAGLVDYHGQTLAPCTMGVFENALGGRVCVAGYYPFSWVSDYYKTLQLKAVFLWLSRNTLPAFVQSYCRIRTVALQGEGKSCVTVFNTTNDTQQQPEIMLKTQKETVSVLTAYAGEQSFSTVPARDGYRALTLPKLDPYEGVVIRL